MLIGLSVIFIFIILIFNIQLLLILKILVIAVLIFIVLFLIDYYSNINFIEYTHSEYYNEKPVYFDDNVSIDIKQKSLQGRILSKEKKIVLCGLARNVEKVINESIKKLEFIGEHFKDYKIVIFENDSSDNTRNLIKEYSMKNNKIILLNCIHLGSEECILKNKIGYEYGITSKNRINKMAQYREEYLNYVKKNLLDYDYMLVCDLDLGGNHCIDGLFTSIAKSNWDAIYINGRTTYWGMYGLLTIPYDSMAYINCESDYVNNSDLLTLIFNYSSMNNDINNSDEFYEVKSAFNGYGLYKISSIKNASYIGDSICEHNNLAKNIYDNCGYQYINKYWVGIFNIQGTNNPLLYLTNFK